MFQRQPPIDSYAALQQALTEHMAYCTCSYDTAVPLLRDVLRLIRERTDGVEDEERFRRASAALRELLDDAGSPGLQSWFIYSLDRADLISHGFNVHDVWIRDRGRWLLQGLERFAEPASEHGEETEPDAAPDSAGP